MTTIRIGNLGIEDIGRDRPGSDWAEVIYPESHVDAPRFNHLMVGKNVIGPSRIVMNLLWNVLPKSWFDNYAPCGHIRMRIDGNTLGEVEWLIDRYNESGPHTIYLVWDYLQIIVWWMRYARANYGRHAFIEITYWNEE